jgi:hypothetical protein
LVSIDYCQNSSVILVIVGCFYTIVFSWIGLWNLRFLCLGPKLGLGCSGNRVLVYEIGQGGIALDRLVIFLLGKIGVWMLEL